MEIDLGGRTALVTGAASGIGAACAHALAASGAHVLSVDISPEALEKQAAELGSEPIVADLTDEEALARLEPRLRAVDVVVNNAGVQHVSPVEEFPPERFAHLVSLMLVAPFRLARAALPGMYARGWGRVSVVHFDAHADTGDVQYGSLIGHGLPMRRLIESGACRGDRFLQIGLRGYWPEPETLAWMAEQGMRSFEMHEVVQRGLDAVLADAFAIATDGCDGVFVSVDVDVVDPGTAPGTGTPEPGGLTGRQLLDAVRRIAIELPVVGIDVVEVSPPYDNPAQITALLAANLAYEMLALAALAALAEG